MWKTPRSVDALVATIRRKLGEKRESARHGLREQPTRDDVLHAFRLILGREPDDENAIRAHMGIATVAELRRVLLSSPEFQGKYKVMNPDCGVHPDLSVQRETTVFFHLQKTGGTTVRAFLERQFAADRICPVHDNSLHLLSPAELGRYDFFSGHFDRSSIRFIPRNNIRTVAMFREPRVRLISFYRFLRSHPVRDEFANDPFIRLATEVSAEEFFERPETRNLPAVNNHYLAALCGSFIRIRTDPDSAKANYCGNSLENAKQQIRALTAIGITERFDQSVELICAVLHLSRPPSIDAMHVTDSFPEADRRFQLVDSVAMTPRLSAAFEELTKFDDDIYRFAVDDFERRCAALIDAAAPL